MPSRWARSDRPGRRARPTSGRGRRRDHEPRPGRRRDPAVEAPARSMASSVFGGSDNIRDAWSPFGNGDMLERAMMIGYRANFRHDEELALAFDMVTARPPTCWASRATASPSAARPISWWSRPARWPRPSPPAAAQARDQSRSHCRQGWRTGPLNSGTWTGFLAWRRVRPCSGWSGPPSSTARPRVPRHHRSCSTARAPRWSARTAPASRPC